ncbi:MAG: CBS domain-containing protein [Rhodovarius sp.]|nr:CBS domain-containing protein [Rhodovarius sp.]MCX7933417.1 CBS domain-containing protein [Rhodovarius sp.]MDW8315793.1 CBS domain-containing protein [Rhodovarius sp.]
MSRIQTMPTAGELMTRRVITVPPSATVAEIARLLCERGISAVPVVSPEGKVLGIVTEADLIRRLAGVEDEKPGWLASLFADPAESAERYARTHGATAADIMTRDPATVSPQDTAAHVAQEMERRHIRRLLVVEEGRLLGIISRADLLRALIQPEEPKETDLPDERIRIAVLEAMAKEPWAHNPFMNVVVQGGVVMFEGFSSQEGIKRGLHVLAMGVPGVKGVIDNTRPLPAEMMHGI